MDSEEKVTPFILPKRARGSYSKDRFRDVEIVTNFYRVQVRPINQIHIFRIKFTPAIAQDDRATRHKILQATYPQIRTKIDEPIVSGFNIYSIKAPTEKQFTVQTQTHQVSIKEVKVLQIKDNPQILVQFLNNGLRNLMTKLKYIQLGKSGKYFNTGTRIQIEKLFMYSGFKANFLQLDKGIYLRVDTAKKIVRNQTVLVFVDQLYRRNADKSKDEKRELLKQTLINKVIMTNYGRPRYVKVIDVEFSDLETTMVPNQNVSIKQYYLIRYNIVIQNQRQPLLVIEQKKKKDHKILMLPQLCLMTGIPDDFDENKRKKVSEITIKDAETRKHQISKLMDEIKNTTELNSLKELGIRIDSHMQKMKAKMIPAPRLRLGKDYKVENGKESGFSLFGQPIYSSKHSIKLAILYFRNADPRQMISIMEDTSKNLGVQFAFDKYNLGEYDQRKALIAIQQTINSIGKQDKHNICLIIIPTHMKNQYKTIKERCLLKNNISCQIVTQATMKKNGFRSVATKILLQLIAKRGNVLWVPESAMKLDRVMLMAFDTTKIGKQNIVSGVASISSTYSLITSRTQQYSDSNNKLNVMKNIALRLIDGYHKRNKQQPKEIVIFSNSCSNDQMNLFTDYFIQPLDTKLAQLYGGNKPNISLILVNTKTSQRFFEPCGGGYRNVPAGTVISEGIVSQNYDFFLVSQYAKKGTAVPNHYKVIYNDSKIQEGILQELIYSQCFNYVNWTGSIKVPGILQYAKKCVRFNAEVLEAKKVSQELEAKLYYI